jgi:PEP-CTERM motif-containing protein
MNLRFAVQLLPSWVRMTRAMAPALALFLSCVFVIFGTSIEAQGRGSGRGGSPPSNGGGNGPPEWARSEQNRISVPEPATLTLLAVGAGGMMVAKAVRNRRSRKR